MIRLDPTTVHVGIAADDGGAPSDRCRLDGVFIAAEVGEAVRTGLRPANGWARSWRVEYRTCVSKAEIPVADLVEIMVGELSAMQAFTWSTRQRHRPDLRFMVSTGQRHLFEPLEEQPLMPVVDFIARMRVVVARPLRVRFDAADGGGSRFPDFVPADVESMGVFDVRLAKGPVRNRREGLLGRGRRWR